MLKKPNMYKIYAFYTKTLKIYIKHQNSPKICVFKIVKSIISNNKLVVAIFMERKNELKTKNKNREIVVFLGKWNSHIVEVDLDFFVSLNEETQRVCQCLCDVESVTERGICHTSSQKNKRLWEMQKSTFL